MQPMCVQIAESAKTCDPRRIRKPSIPPDRNATGVLSGRAATAMTDCQLPCSTSAIPAPRAGGCSSRWIPSAAATPAAIPAERVLVRQRHALGLSVLEQVFDLPVELLGIVVHDTLPRSRPARLRARNCNTLTFVSLRLSSRAVSRTE